MVLLTLELDTISTATLNDTHHNTGKNIQNAFNFSCMQHCVCRSTISCIKALRATLALHDVWCVLFVEILELQGFEIRSRYLAFHYFKLPAWDSNVANVLLRVIFERKPT